MTSPTKTQPEQLSPRDAIDPHPDLEIFEDPELRQTLLKQMLQGVPKYKRPEVASPNPSATTKAKDAETPSTPSGAPSSTKSYWEDLKERHPDLTEEDLADIAKEVEGEAPHPKRRSSLTRRRSPTPPSTSSPNIETASSQATFPRLATLVADGQNCGTKAPALSVS